MTTHAGARDVPAARLPLLPLLQAAHAGPALAVTVIAALLAVSAGQPVATSVVVTAAVLTGQLTIGWGNDLLDRGRDRTVGRTDKPLATGALSPRPVAVLLALSAAASVVLSFAAGWRSGLVHLGLGVASGHAYNLGLKGTPWSWLPYAVAFGSLPAVASLAGSRPELPPAWMVAAAAALGVAAHFLNTLPDLADDAATGVRGLPHRLGARTARVVATTLLMAASAAAVLGPAGSPGVVAVVALLLVLVLGGVALAGRGRAPFAAAIGIALVDVMLLLVGAR